KVQAGKPTATVTITEQAAVAELMYLITVSSGEAKAELKEFSYSFRPESRIRLTHNSAGRTFANEAIGSEDGVIELTIPSGTLVTKNGKALDEVAIKVIDRNFDGLENNIVLGQTAYMALPEGAEFEPPIRLTFRYDKKRLPLGYSEDDLAIAYYDKEADMWKAVDSEVDRKNNKIIARLSHFSTIAAVYGCTGKEIVPANLGFLYRSPCYTEGEECPEWIIKSPDGSFLRRPEGAGQGAVEHNAEDGPIYAPENGVKVYKQFEERSAVPCTLKDWDPDDGLPETYGYQKVMDAGSAKSGATYIFTFETKGNSCIFEDKGITVKLSCDDECADFKYNGKAINALQEGNDYTIQIRGEELKDLKAGKENTVSFTVNNLYEACSGAEASMTMHGTGAFQNVMLLKPYKARASGIKKADCAEGQNKFGMFTLLPFDERMEAQLDKVHELTGDCGWVLQGAYGKLALSPGNWMPILSEAEARNLVVIIRFPEIRASSDYTALSRKYTNFLSQLKDSGTRIRYVQIGNEPNMLKEGWMPAAYAEMHVTIAKAIRAAHPGIKILNAGLSPNKNPAEAKDAIQFIKDVCSYNNREIRQYIDVWASHSYLPEPNFYESELQALKDNCGISEIKVMITETGRQKAELAPEDMVGAYKNWNSDSRVIGATPFLLFPTSNPDWTEWNWIEKEGDKYVNTRQYDAIRALRQKALYTG
ncbi:hypothetical protein HYV82_00270, partial [Candidatus Woesearchaeota archaeon]|nr:hypothetical protein [Candidatus Woesearchaeota archaeon]